MDGVKVKWEDLVVDKTNDVVPTPTTAKLHS